MGIPVDLPASLDNETIEIQHFPEDGANLFNGSNVSSAEEQVCGNKTDNVSCEFLFALAINIVFF